jgi:ubiquinone/menaquinone biosynthesis C-methylase UbiE
MIQVLNEKASKAQLKIATRRASFCNLSVWKKEKFDAVISGGNSVSVLNNFVEIDKMIKSMMGVARSKGIVVIGARDYSILRDRNEAIQPRKIHFKNENTPEWVFDLRLFGKNSARVVNVFLSPSKNRWKIRTFTKSYLYVAAEKLARKMKENGLLNVHILDVDGYKPYSGGEWYLVVGEKE